MAGRGRQGATRGGAAHVRVVPWLAWGVLLTTVGLLLAALGLWATAPPPPPGVEQFSASAWAFSAAMVAFAFIGALIVVRAAGNPLGWMLGLFALLMVASPFAYQWALAGLPGWDVAAWLNAWLWIVPIAVLAHAVLRFPHGRLPSRGWRWVSRTATAGIAATVGVGVALWSERGLVLLTVGDQFPGVADSVAGVALLLVFGSFVAAALSLVVRLHRARGEERQQVKWLVYAVAVVAVGLVAFAVGDIVLNGAQPLIGEVLGTVGIVGIPVAMWIAITKYRLYEIDRLISRTLSYAALTALLVGLYALIAIVPSALFAVDSDLLVAAATLAAAGAFRPLRRRLQLAVDRRFNRTRYDAMRTIDAFAIRLRGETGLTTLVGDLAGVVGDTMQPASVTVWLRDQDAR